MTLADREKEELERIEREPTGADLRLARCCAPGRLHRPRRTRPAPWLVSPATVTRVAFIIGSALAA